MKEIKRKIDSVRNIWRLTSALETLSALKMKKAQKIALLSRPFAEKTAQLLRRLDFNLQESRLPFFEKKEGKRVLILVLASDRGFCGSFNQNILKFAEKSLEGIKKEKDIELLPIGKKAISYFKKKGYDIRFSFFGIGDYAELEDIKKISDFIIDKYLKNEFQKIYLFYTDFLSTFLQKPRKFQLLPLDKENLGQLLKEKGSEDILKKNDFLIEPSCKLIIQEIVPQLIQYLIYQAVLEANASEHSARMMAMRNASDNAQKKVFELNLQYNKARQEQITKEVGEILSAKEVLE